MRFILCFVLLAPSAGAAQSALWAHVPAVTEPRPELVELGPRQRDAIERAVLREESWCLDERPELSFRKIQLSRVPVVLVEAGGCGRGAQGANGEMWLVRINGRHAVLLASPRDGFTGWVFRLGSGERLGFRDVIVGLHQSAFETSLTYFQFGGQRYRKLSSASLLGDGEGHLRIEEGRSLRQVK